MTTVQGQKVKSQGHEVTKRICSKTVSQTVISAPNLVEIITVGIKACIGFINFFYKQTGSRNIADFKHIKKLRGNGVRE